MTSLSAIGMPSPPGSSTVRRYAWSSPSRSRMASRYASCSSAAVSSRRSSSPIASSAVSRRVSTTAMSTPRGTFPPTGGARSPCRQRTRAADRPLSRMCAENAPIPSLRRRGRRRDAEGVVLALRRVRERDVEREARERLVVGPHVDERERVRGRLDALEIELGDLPDGLEDHVELLAEALDLLVRQRE